jgi:hypothetical protein
VSATGNCVADGTVVEGQPCVLNTANLNAWEDNCVAGTLCDNDGPNNAYFCSRICASDATCSTSAQKCASLFTTEWGFCLSACTPYGSDCPDGNNCGVAFNDVSVTPTSVTGFFVCKIPGAGGLLDPCQGLDTACGPDLVCDSKRNVCTPICDAAHLCPTTPPSDGGADVSCQPFTNLDNGQGVCS